MLGVGVSEARCECIAEIVERQHEAVGSVTWL